MSARFDASDVRGWTGAALTRAAPDTAFSGVSIDSRTVSEGELFVAIAGPNHDGHDHLAGAASAGAAGCLIESGRALPGGLGADFVVLAVADTTRALGDLAAGHRTRHRGAVVGITGSNGKTSTREMCAAILGVAGPCLSTAGNLNNQYGLPLTLLRREEGHRTLVIELGTNYPGEIARLTEITRPTVGVLTNVGTAHIEFLGSREGIAREKGELLAGLDPDGTAILNGDDPLVLSQAARTTATVVRFGLGPGVDVRGEDVAWREGSFAFSFSAPEGRVDVRVAGLGAPTVSNALAAGAAALAAGASLEQVAGGLAAYRPVRGRLEPVALPGDVLLIDDTYNANPQSLEVALRELATGPACADGRHIAVLGDMGELGAQTEAAHRAAGSLAAKLGIDFLYAVGAQAGNVAEGARGAGLAADRVLAETDWERVAEALEKRVQSGDRVLVKGSRAMRLERIVERIAAAAGGGR
jgi:UDP-N-acetylmuramoyl-tripeptide--D-alanyl-D-alanine ligase